MDRTSDEDLMKSVYEGRLDRLNTLCQRYQRRIFGYMLKSTLNAEDSADLAQQVFIRALKYRKSYRIGKSFEMWVFQIARNVLKDYFRKMKIHNERYEFIDQIPDMVDEVDEEKLENEKKLIRAMEQLPEDKRELLVLSKFEGMKYEQIAELRSMSVSAVKVQVHRTMKRLKELYFNLN